MAKFVVNVIHPTPELPYVEAVRSEYVLEAQNLAEAQQRADDFASREPSWNDKSSIKIKDGGQVVASRHATETWRA